MPIEKFNNLRERAELQLNSVKLETEKLSMKDIKSILHELQVHQIELELQNEELIEASYKLKESELKYFEFFNNAPNGFMVIDVNGRILEVNKKSAEIFETDKSILLNSDLNIHIAWDDRDNIYFLLEDLKLSGEEHSTEVRLKSKNGKDKLVNLYAKKLIVNDNLEPKIRLTIIEV